MNRNTAGGLRSACSRVLEALGEGWEQINIAELDVEETLVRFQNRLALEEKIAKTKNISCKFERW